MATKIIAGFPGVGKTFFKESSPECSVLDSDSSKFGKADFPNNYIEHIKDSLGKVDIILVSTHKELRDALDKNNLGYTLVYPNRDCKEEYIKRYTKRGDQISFIELIRSKWDIFITQLEEQQIKLSSSRKIELKRNQYLSDVSYIFNESDIVIDNLFSSLKILEK